MNNAAYSETATCVCCGYPGNIIDLPVTYDGQDVCWACADEGYMSCSKCGLMFDSREIFKSPNEDDFLCLFCAEREYGVHIPTLQKCLPCGQEK